MAKPIEPAGDESVPVMGADQIALPDLADELQVRRQSVHRVARRLGIRTNRRRESERGNQLVATVTRNDAATIRKEIVGNMRSNPEGDPAKDPLLTTDAEEGVFYLVQLEPDHDPGRFKVGFTTDLEARLRKHRCSAPFATCSKSWPCRRTWERAAMDCVTVGVPQLHTEVFRAESLNEVVTRGDRFFSVMPPVSGAPETGEDSSLDQAG